MCRRTLPDTWLSLPLAPFSSGGRTTAFSSCLPSRSPKKHVSPACEIEPLYTLLHREYWLGLILVRLGVFGIGVVRGETLVSSKVGTGLVHARHRQGGSSAHRFERHGKADGDLFTRVCTHTREQLEPYAAQWTMSSTAVPGKHCWSFVNSAGYPSV